jgi:hypothetical protein
MKWNFRKISRLAACCSFCLLLPAAGYAKDRKLTADDLVARHLESLGSAQARIVRSRILNGSSEMILRLPTAGRLEGSGNLLSQEGKVRLAIGIVAQEFEGEHLAFDGSRVRIATKRPGSFTVLTSLIQQADLMLTEGLVGGTLSTAWPLLDLAGRRPRLDYRGLKSVEREQLHELRYRARRGSADLRVTIFFQADTYRHVMTEYRLILPAPMGANPAGTHSSADRIYKMVERFADFRTEEGLTLPRSYRLELSVEGQGPTILMEYVLLFHQIMHNQELDENLFVLP